MLGVQPPKVAVVVINWNMWRLSLDCVASLRSTQGVDWHVFLVDNASTDGSRERLCDLGDRVTVIWSEVNGGWTGGNNLGVAAALRAGFEHILILNNDAQVRPDTIRTLLDVLGDGDAARPPVLGPVHLDPDGSLDFVGASLDRATGLPLETKAHEVDLRAFGPVYDTAYIRGAAMFAHRVHFEQVGLFDDTFYLFYDDTDWCMRAALRGFKVAMARDAQVVHAGSATTGKGSPLLVYFIVRNGLLFAERYCGPVQRLRHAAWLLRWLARLEGEGSRFHRLLVILFGSGDRSVAARRGMRDYLLRRFGDCPDEVRRPSGSDRG